MDWKDLIGKNIFIKTESVGVYSGILNDIVEKYNRTWLEITDKFGENISIRADQILKLVEESNSKPKKGLSNYS